MTLKIVKNAGQNYLMLNNFKFREGRTLRDGKISWLCSGHSCNSWVKTDKDKHKIMDYKIEHNHKSQIKSPAVTPASSRKASISALPPAATPCTVTATTSVAAFNTPVTPASTSTSTPAPSPSPVCITSLLTENSNLKEEIKQLQEQKQTILNHSIESDQRLLQFTDQVFVTTISPRQPKFKNQSSQTDNDCLVRSLISENQILREKCLVLEEESRNMIISIRTLEEEIKILKTTSLVPSKESHSIPVHNKYEVLSQPDQEDQGFMVVTNKTKHHKKKKQVKLNKKTEPRNRYFTEKKKIRIPFKKVSIMGDSHARHLAGLMLETVDSSASVSGTCLPGAGLLNISPDPTPPPDNCFVLIAGNNDVAVGRQNVIFRNIEGIIKKCSTTSTVLVTPLLPRHDLPSDSPVHELITVANAYISELCVRSKGVEMLGIDRLERQHFTSHGQHLRAGGKRLLTTLMVERLASMTPRPRRSPAPALTSHCGLPVTSADAAPAETGNRPPAQPQPHILPYETFADALKSSPHHGTPSQPDSMENSRHFLGTSISRVEQN